MLPDFPSLRNEINKILMAKLRRRVDTGDPVLAQIKRTVQHEGNFTRYEQYGGTVVEEGFDEVGTQFEIPIAEVPYLVGDKLNAKLEELAQSLIAQSAKLFFKKVGDSCQKAGTAKDAAGKPLTAEMFLEMIGSVETAFDANGNPTNTFILHPDMLPAAKKIAEQIENDPDLKRKHTEILDRQREAWAARESNRKLVD